MKNRDTEALKNEKGKKWKWTSQRGNKTKKIRTKRIKHKEDLMNFSTSVLDTIITSSGFSFLQKGRSTPEISSKLFARYILKIVMQSENLFN